MKFSKPISCAYNLVVYANMVVVENMYWTELMMWVLRVAYIANRNAIVRKWKGLRVCCTVLYGQYRTPQPPSLVHLLVNRYNDIINNIKSTSQIINKYKCSFSFTKWVLQGPCLGPFFFINVHEILLVEKVTGSYLSISIIIITIARFNIVIILLST